MLLHSPAYAKGWNTFLGAVRTGLELPPRLRELAMCVVAVLNGADYEFHHHAPEFIKAGGTQQQVDALWQISDPGWEAKLFDTAERATIALTVEMTRDVEVEEATFAAARSALGSDRLLVELAGVIAAYNMVSRFLVVLQIAPEQIIPEEAR